MPAVARTRHLCRALTARLERLGETLDALRERLQEAVAQAIGQAVAGAVREAVVALLSELPGRSNRSSSSTWSSDPYRPGWPERRENAYTESSGGGWWTADEDEEEYDEVNRAPPTSVQPTTSRWSTALAVGCRVAAWCLYRRSNKRPFLTAAGVGVACATAAYAAGTYLAGSTLRLMTLAGVLASAVAALVWTAAP
jgi:hypothetical protein